MASAENKTELAAVESLPVPAGRYSSQYPPVPADDVSNELGFADAWVTEALDADFRVQARQALLEWAVEGEAADTLPGVPASVANKALYASLADPSIGGGTGTSPIPSQADWNADVAAARTRHVSGVTASVDPSWTRLVSDGFVPTDPLLAFVDVSGTVTLTTPHRVTSTVRLKTKGKKEHARTRRVTRTIERSTKRNFSMVLTVGSALRHPGYGAVSVSDWSTS